MVFAQGVDFDVFDDDHLLVLFLEEGVFENFLRIQCITLREELHRLCNPQGCF